MAQTQKPSQPVGTDQSNEAIVLPQTSVPDPQIPSDAPAAGGIETYYRLRAHTILDEQKIACPIAAKPGSQQKTSEVITVALGSAELVVEWSAWRKSQRPQMPRPYIEDDNLVLLSNTISLDGYEEEADNDLYFISAGEYRYCWVQRSQLTLSFPLAPFYTIQDKSMLVATDSDFVPNVINSGWPNNRAKNAITKP